MRLKSLLIKQSAFSVLLCALTMLTLFVSASVAETTMIEIGTTSLPPDLVNWLTKEIHTFETLNPGITVKTLELGDPIRPYSRGIRQIERLAANVIAIQGGFDNETAYLASRGLLVPIDNFLPDPDIDLDVYPESLLESVQLGDKLWGIPLRADAMWIYCDWPMFKEAGLLRPPRTWEECLEYARKLTKDTDGDGSVDQWGLAIPPSKGMRTFLWLSMNAQDRVTYLDGGHLNFDQPAIRKNLEFVRTLSNSGVTYEETVTRIRLTPGHGTHVAMLLVNNFIPITATYTDFMKLCITNPRFKVAKLPGRDSIFYPEIRLYLAIRPSTTAKEKASWKLIKWLTRREVSLPAYWFGSPCRTDLVKRADFGRWSARFCEDFEVLLQIAGRGQPADFQLMRDSQLPITNLAERYFDGGMEIDELISQLESTITWEPVEFPQPLNRGALFH